MADNYVLYVMTRLFVYVLVALGLNLLTGYAGQVSLGHAAFFAIGAYTAAVLAERWQWPSLLCLLAAALFTGLVGYLLGLPCLRLSGLYLAMATLGFTLIVQEMLLQLAVLTHGSEGHEGGARLAPGAHLRQRYAEILPAARRHHGHAGLRPKSSRRDGWAEHSSPSATTSGRRRPWA